MFIYNESSEQVLKKYGKEYTTPFYYLDAHCYDYDYWPLKDEIQSIEKGIICISDYCLGYNNEGIIYHGDEYDGIQLDREFLINCNINSDVYVNNYNALEKYYFPCLQMQRRCGRAYVLKNLEKDYLKENVMFLKLHL